jgi:putative protease
MATRRKAILGRVTNYFRKVDVAEIEITANSVKVGDEIVITGPTTGVLIETVKTMEMEGRRIEKAVKGDSVGIKVSRRVRKNDAVYIWEKD